ncbi:unnamed protein product [Lepeophtheirus salmonis]|uniref:(salmon louse) hypothetical protein n=1 Tax=Lepeophtheirus salmonis TaxID=72036 RepID=A0A7R8D271_LEPSM|nr:unnamed protein product [Lepeophtheirus salmonis]CAF3002706.1 unnamed protein product [Lepeophtheirus salmonis]
MARKLSHEDWKDGIFSDKSSFPLYWILKKQVDRIWARYRENIMPVETGKKSPGIQVWGVMSASGLFDLHIMLRSFRLTAHTYVSDILEANLEPILARTKFTGQISSRKLVHRRSGVIFNTMVLLH